MKRPHFPFLAKAATGIFTLVAPLCAILGQDSLEVTFIGDRELEVRDAIKPTSSPHRIDLGIQKPTIQYAPIAKSIAPETQVQTIAPFAIRMDAPLPRLYAGYAKGGFGLYSSPLAEVHFGETQSRKGSWGVDWVHRSSAGSTGQVDSLGLDEGWSHNAVAGHLKRFIDKSSLSLNAGWERDAWGLHGLDLSQVSSVNFSAPTGRQVYSRLHASARLQNHQRDSTKVQRDIQLKVSRLALGMSPLPEATLPLAVIFGAGRENILSSTGSFSAWREDALYKLDFEGHLIGSTIDVSGDWTAGPLSRNSALIGAMPSVTKERGAYKVRVGAGIWVDAKGSQAFHFYPTAEVRFRLLDDVFVPYGGVDGGMQRNALHDMIQENPWFNAHYNLGTTAPRSPLQHTNRALELYGGLRGKLTRDLAFNVQARTVRYRDFGYWVNETGIDGTGQRFSLGFDTLTVASAIGEAAYRGRSPLELEARAEFNTYGTGRQPHAWYQPRTRFSGTAKWNLDDILHLDMGLEVVGARYAPSRTPFAQVLGADEEIQSAGEAIDLPVFGGTDTIYSRKLPAYTALNIGVEYRYNARLAMGLDAAGPLGQTQIFNGYNAQQFRIMMWAGYRF